MLIGTAKKRKIFVGTLLFILVGLIIFSDFLGGLFVFSDLKRAYGVPYFSRKYNVNCNTCHVMPPVLNQFGENFLANGYQFPNEEHSQRTWPFALWLTQRGESQHSKDFDKSFPNKVELISGGTIGDSPMSYFLEWRILSLQTRSDHSLRDRSGRFEDLFITYNVSNSLNLKAGQYRLLNQIDDSRKLGLSTPLVIGAKIGGSNGLDAFAPASRSPSVSLELKTMHRVNAADGWFNIISLSFPGEFSIPLTDEARDEASFEFDSQPKGVFLESFYRKRLSSVGAHLFLDDSRSMGSIIGVYNKGRWFSRLGLGYGRSGGDTDGRFTWENEFIPLNFFSIGARIDHQTEAVDGTAFVTNVNLQWPRTLWTLRLVIEQRIRSNNQATLAELSLVF